MPGKPISQIRREILHEKGVQPEPGSKKMVKSYDHFPKTDKMKLVEQALDQPIEDLIMGGTIDEVVVRIRQMVDRSTVSKWRKYIRQHTGR